MSMNFDKLEALTAERKKTWLALHCAIGADAAATAFAKQCKEEMGAACRADEQAASALHDFVRDQATEPK
jgi:hypothetical protein